MAYLSGSYAMSEDAERWDSREVRQKLFASIQGMEAHEVQVELAAQFSVDRGASERR